MISARSAACAGRFFLPAFLVLLCLFSLVACGKKGDPEPRDASRSFSWAEVQATMAGKCLAFSGKLQGAYGNLDGVRLELSAVGGPDDCPGCPFVPREVYVFSAKDAGFNQRDGSVGFSYCPGAGQAYQWRLIGMSIYNSLPHAVSPVQTTVNTSR